MTDQAQQVFGVGANIAMLENGPWVLHGQKTNQGGFALTLELRGGDGAQGRAAQLVVADKAGAAAAVKTLHTRFDKIAPTDLAAATGELQRRIKDAPGDEAEQKAAMADYMAKVSGKPAFPFKDEEIASVIEHLFGEKGAE